MKYYKSLTLALAAVMLTACGTKDEGRESGNNAGEDRRRGAYHQLFGHC